MMRLLVNILEISKIESGKMPVAHEPITLAAVADEVAEEYGAVAERTGRRLGRACAAGDARNPRRRDYACARTTRMSCGTEDTSTLR